MSRPLKNRADCKASPPRPVERARRAVPLQRSITRLDVALVASKGVSVSTELVRIFPGETAVLVIYDIEDDRTRGRISERCKDFGLERVQYSAFYGSLSRSKREELGMKLEEELGGKDGKIWIQPICAKDDGDARRIETIASAPGQ